MIGPWARLADVSGGEVLRRVKVRGMPGWLAVVLVVVALVLLWDTMMTPGDRSFWRILVIAVLVMLARDDRRGRLRLTTRTLEGRGLLRTGRRPVPVSAVRAIECGTRHSFLGSREEPCITIEVEGAPRPIRIGTGLAEDDIRWLCSHLRSGLELAREAPARVSCGPAAGRRRRWRGRCRRGT